MKNPVYEQIQARKVKAGPQKTCEIVIGNLCQFCYDGVEVNIHRKGLHHAYP